MEKESQTNKWEQMGDEIYPQQIMRKQKLTYKLRQTAKRNSTD